MIPYFELLQTDSYWMVQIQNDFFQLAQDALEEHGTQEAAAKALLISTYQFAQILHGDFNGSLTRLVEIALAMGYVPKLQFVPIEEFLQSERDRIETKRLAKQEAQDE